MHTWKFLFAFFALASTGIAMAQSSGSTLTVIVENLRSDKGQVIVRLFNSEEGYPREEDRAIRKLSAPISSASATVRFENLRPTDYALTLIHDENENGIIDLGFLGIPKEGFGFSRNPSIFGAPDFEETQIFLPQDGLEISVKVRYL